ncbi:hypothetical protein EAH89_25180 [Roseomonas nepalensis]|uniref:Uncharacterized protein n=1 Tax=Muricoccus nepalensis TaxID=1854500 RepID=A0A502F9F7_9PROT|nr:hypothetical protein [Roseomonas nepalensis]TPG46028.1 hypothetical protein EAH89_25180 [Roseomonas nepalensis]
MELARLREAPITPLQNAQPVVASLPYQSSFSYKALTEHLFIGLFVLVVMHLLLASLPPLPAVAAYRAITLAVALPFGVQFERSGGPRLPAQILVALAFATLAVAVVTSIDGLLGIHLVGALSPVERVQTGMAITLGHLTGSISVQWWQKHLARTSRQTEDMQIDVTAIRDLLRNPERLKAGMEAYRSIVEACAPVAAAAAALWATFSK